jgi:hypothetical protein
MGAAWARHGMCELALKVLNIVVPFFQKAKSFVKKKNRTNHYATTCV